MTRNAFIGKCAMPPLPLGELDELHYFVGIGKPEWQVRKASHCGSKQQ